MWQRLSVLALCGMSALWADACDGLPTLGDGTGSSLIAPAVEVRPTLLLPQADPEPPQISYRLSVKPGLAAFRITVRNSPFADIEVARCQDGRRLQLLPIMADEGINLEGTFSAHDINFDGYLDLSVLRAFGLAGRYDPRSYWVYDPSSGLFVQNELTQELGEKSNVDFDPKKHEISWFFIPSPPTPSCADWGRYRVENNRLILIHKEEVTRSTQGPLEPDQPYCTVTVSDLIGGTMRVTEVRRFDAQGRSVK
ncbi:MAG TPA: hypothetical protein VH639_23720 [Bryobacteraceae bacterium]